MQITFDSTSLVSAPYSVSKLSSEEMNNRDLFVYELARQRGGVLINSEYRVKRFIMEGTIFGNDSDDLDANVDEFKELINRQNKNLDISYASGTRRFVVTVAKIEIDREYYNVTFVPFRVEFVVPDGVGYDITETTSSSSGITNLVNTGTLSILGSAPPKVKLTITVSAANSITSIDFLANGNKVTLTATIAASDIIIFDANTMKVTQNGVEKAYTGIFPEFVVGANAYQIEAHGTSITYAQTFAYTKTYL